MLGEALVRGLRLETDLAAALADYAQTQAREHSEAAGELIEPNMAGAARDLLRRGLGLCSGAHSCEREGFFRGLREARQKMASALTKS